MTGRVEVMAEPFSTYDSRHYPTLDVAAGYGEWAQSYDRTVDPEMDSVLLAKAETVDWRQIQIAVDLGCGTGRIGAWLRQRGIPSIHGVDCCQAMLQRAEAKRTYERLCTADITACPLPSHAYDLAITVLAACHLPDLRALYTEAARLLRPRGIFVLLDYHPFFLLKGAPTHFHRATGEPVAIENVIHLISDHVNIGRSVNWTLLEMREPMVDEAWIAQAPGMAPHANQPASFMMVWRAGT